MMNQLLRSARQATQAGQNLRVVLRINCAEDRQLERRGGKCRAVAAHENQWSRRGIGRRGGERRCKGRAVGCVADEHVCGWAERVADVKDGCGLRACVVCSERRPERYNLGRT